MNRTFLSLYLLIALGIAAAGWGLDKLWQHLSPPPALSSAQHNLLAIIEAELKSGQALKLPQNLKGKVDILSLEDFASSTLRDDLASGKTVTLHNQNGQLHIYKRANGHDEIVRLELPVTAQKSARH